ncbi:hypothetical protein [Agromyces atrinae]|uniref:Uncharacterized protein n=1 Tax=Agromyces atrinae TaxID=592376 RepID=A0A4Q2M511_9MICO|nr:hypothetical protein [Agromyces atrinae]NYD65997.1 hypothetical protein [Agromyces atrinae]RXZ86327.1 hypothetical protein ESP50_11255 [Agromyces atrinae]
MKTAPIAALAVTTLALTGCASFFSDHTEALENSVTREAILVAGAPTVTDARLSAFVDHDVIVTMFLRVDESFSALTLCHTIAAAVDHIPFSVDTLKLGIAAPDDSHDVDSEALLAELGVSSDDESLGELPWDVAEAVALTCDRRETQSERGRDRHDARVSSEGIATGW